MRFDTSIGPIATPFTIFVLLEFIIAKIVEDTPRSTITIDTIKIIIPTLLFLSVC